MTASILNDLGDLKLSYITTTFALNTKLELVDP